MADQNQTDQNSELKKDSPEKRPAAPIRKAAPSIRRLGGSGWKKRKEGLPVIAAAYRDQRAISVLDGSSGSISFRAVSTPADRQAVGLEHADLD